MMKVLPDSIVLELASVVLLIVKAFVVIQLMNFDQICKY